MLAGLATKSVAVGSDAAAQAALGDTWWDVAQVAEAAQKPELLAGANYWYGLAAPLLSGLQKSRLEKRMGEMASSLPASKIPATNLPDGPSNASPGTVDD